ncbi:Uncharacterised protein [Mycobacterium tuberculosis]|nr:Uncharacterised protein [Mycobacterium tuberculosis]
MTISTMSHTASMSAMMLPMIGRLPAKVVSTFSVT